MADNETGQDSANGLRELATRLLEEYYLEGDEDRDTTTLSR